MADKSEDREKEVSATPDKSKPVIIMLIVLAILVLVFTPIVTILALKAFVPKDDDAAAKERISKAAEVKLDDFKFNVAQSQGTRFAMVSVIVEVSDGDMAKYFQLSTKENPDGMGNRIRSEILDMLSERTIDGLLTKDARNTLRKEIQSKLNAILSDHKVKGVVTDVYFPSFLVQ